MTPTVIITLSFIVAAAILYLDQATKGYIASHYSPNEYIVGIPQISLVYVTNRGGVCGYAQQAGMILIVMGIITNLIILFAILFLMPHSRVYAIAFGCLLAGAAGNLIDRLHFGYVIDFITLNFLNWPSFNLADASILGGISLTSFMILREMLLDPPGEESQHEKWHLDGETILFLMVAAVLFIIVYAICIYHPFG